MELSSIAGRQLGEFVVRERIGGGGFGDVYRAEQPGLEREAVIKVLQMRRGADPVTVQRFMREARLASKLDHPYAAHMYAFGAEPDGTLWIAMELVRGTPLDKILWSQGALKIDRYVPVLEQICEVLQTAHDQGIVHRDIKPANVMLLTRAGRLLPKLLDFGLAKLIENTGAAGAVTVGEAVAVLPASPVGETLAIGKSRSDDTDTVMLPRDSSAPGIATSSGPSAAADWSMTHTEAGALLGTPAYMSPEQWRGTLVADARSDQYSLAVLSFEALTARRPFMGETMDELRSAHLHEPLPELGAGFPTELDAALRKAAAKSPDERFASMLEFARAVRTAAGLDGPQVALPKLEEVLREATIRDAPKPIAEAVLALDGARNAHQARDALGALVRAAARYVGVVALACRSRVGAGREADAPEVLALLQALRRRELADDEWVALARGLVAPFIGVADAYPVPELVALLSAGSDELFGLGGPDEDPYHAGAGEAAARASLERGLPFAEALLRKLAFLSEYQLVVARGDVLEQWMGARRVPRTMPPSGARLEEGHPALADWQGRPIVSLWPLVQVAPPVEGARGEVFLLAGRRRHGALLVAPPHGFERDDDTVWDWFRDRILSDDVAASDGGRAETPPYRGLSPFRAEDAALYFGRELEVVELANKIRLAPLVAVVGPSGAGKSSLVQAGVVPGLPKSWRLIALRPGAAPLAALAARLGIDAKVLRDELQAAPSALAGRLAGGEDTLVFVDQLEELFTLCADAEERDLFARALVQIAPNADGPVRVVCTLRDDFLVRAEELPALRRKIGAGMHVVTTPAPADLRRILVEPARRAGYEFEDTALPDEMVAEIVAKPGALALLSFTAERLWELRDRHFGQLTRAAYRGMGGVGGALAAHAEAFMTSLSVEEQRLVRELFRHLVTAEGTRAVLSRRELVQLLAGGAHAEEVVEKLVAARLLAASEAPADGGRADEQIEIIHEALLGAWPRLVGWRREDAEGARLRDQLRAAARQWEDRGRPRGLLWRDEALTELQLWRGRAARALTGSEGEFAAASVTEARRSLRLRRFATGAAFAALALLAAVLYLLYRQAGVDRARAEERAREAGQRVAQLYMEQGRQALLARDPMRALVYLDEALDRGLTTTATRFLIARATEVLDEQLAVLAGHGDSVRAIAVSPDGSRVATGSADKTARIFDSRTGAELTTLRHGQMVRTVAFAPDGKRLLTASNDGTAVLWDLASGQPVQTLRHGGPVGAAIFLPDGDQILTRSSDGSARLWDAASGAEIRAFTGHTQAIFSMSLHVASGRLATGSADHSVIVWDLATGKPVTSVGDFRGSVMALAFSPDGRQLVASSHEQELRVLDPRDGHLLFNLVGDPDVVLAAAYSPDGARILTSGYDRVAHIWDSGTGRLLVTLEGHDGPVTSSRFSRDGRRVLTSSGDGTARIWDASTGKALAMFVGHREGLLSADWSLDEERVVTGSSDRTARVWEGRPTDLAAALDGAGGAVRAAVWQEGGRVAIATAGGGVQIWDPASGVHGPDIGGVSAAALSPTGRRAVVVDDSGVRLVDENGGPVAALGVNEGPAGAFSFSADGGRLVTTSAERGARVWDATTGKPVATLASPAGKLAAAALDAGGRRAVTASADGTIQLWDVASGETRAAMAQPGGGPVVAVAFSADGKRLMSGGGADKTARVWDAASGAPVAMLAGHRAPVTSVAASPDGALLVTGAADGAARIFEASTGKLLLVLDRFAAPVTVVAVSQDGKRLLGADESGAARIFTIATDARTAAEIAHDVRCRVPFALEGDLVVPTETRDASCAGEARAVK